MQRKRGVAVSDGQPEKTRFRFYLPGPPGPPGLPAQVTFPDRHTSLSYTSDTRPPRGINLSDCADKAFMKSGASSIAVAETRAFRVLIVDQEQSNREFLDRVLRQPGYETALAADGFEAIRIAETHGPFDLLITDVVIPGIPGDELARRLRASEPGLKILYLTEQSGRLFEERTTLWEEEAFLEKPLTVQGLLEAAALILVGHIPAPRAVRVRVPDARVRFENRVADLVMLSVTGTLVRDSEELPVGSTWRIALELPTETLALTGRVVSCNQAKAAAPDEVLQKPYSIAMAFVGPSAGARRTLQRIVQEAHKADPQP